MVNKEIALSLPHRTTLRHKFITNMRARVNGKCKTWKRKPHVFRLPMKYGLNKCFYITQHNADDWEVAA